MGERDVYNFSLVTGYFCVNLTRTMKNCGNLLKNAILVKIPVTTESGYFLDLISVILVTKFQNKRNLTGTY